MATEVLVTVKPDGGGDYTTLNTAEAGEQRNLVTADEISIIEVYSGDGAGGGHGPCTVAGWTTNSTHYIVVRVAAGHQHSGRWDTTKAHYFGTDAALQSSQEFVTFNGLQLYRTGTPSNTFGLRSVAPEGAASTVTFVDCIYRQDESSANTTRGFDAQGPLRGINCIVYGPADAALVGPTTTGDNIELYNCTLIGKNRGLRITDADGSKTVKNCYCHGRVTSSYAVVGTVTTDQVATSDATGPDTALHNIAFSTGTFERADAEDDADLILIENSPLIDQGVNVASENGSVATDIQGEPRDVLWDVGADEFVSAAVEEEPPEVVPPTRDRFRQRRRRTGGAMKKPKPGPRWSGSLSGIYTLS